jgi:hypothetical protein
MTHGEIRECVDRGIATRADYRRWLERENYPADEALMLELLLESTLRGQQEAAKQKQLLEAERAAEKAKAAAEKAQREAAIAAKKTNIAAPLSDLERAVVLGIVPIGVYEARLVSEQFAADDRAFMVDLLQHQREEYLAAQEKKADQAGALARKSISLSALDRAVLAGIMSLDEYRRRLEPKGWTPATRPCWCSCSRANCAIARPRPRSAQRHKRPRPRAGCPCRKWRKLFGKGCWRRTVTARG